MKWGSHLRIAEWVGSNLNLSEQALIKLASGSVTPDSWWDHSYHHNSKYLNKRIRARILTARRLFLNHRDESFFEIGVALHYMADKLVPIVSQVVHLNIEEELAKISASKKEEKFGKLPKNAKKHLEEIRQAIQDLKIGDEEKTLLLDPNWTKGKGNTLKLALSNLPRRTDSELLFHIARRISIGVTGSIISTDPPPQLLWEKFKAADKSILRAIAKFRVHCLLEIGLPLLFFICGKVGFLAYFLTVILNLVSIISIISILRGAEVIRSYLNFRDYSKTLFLFFLLTSLGVFFASIFNFQFFLSGVILSLIAVLHLCYPKILVDKELEDEIDWYDWEKVET